MNGGDGQQRCPACAAPRTSSSLNCAECGALTPTTVAHDLPCRRCGYSLQGLRLDALCPECGSPVRLSMMGDFLGASDPAHLTRLVRGAMMVEIALYLGVLLWCVGSPIAVAMVPRSSGVGGVVVGIASVTLSLLGLAGWWLVTSRDPGLHAASRGETSRRTLRACVGVSAASSLLGTAGITSGSLLAGTGLGPALVQSGVALGTITWLVKYFAIVSYVHVLAARIPSTGLRDTARTLVVLPLWIFGIGIPLLVVSAILASFASPVALVGLLVLAGMGMGVLVWFIWYCSMVSGLRDRLESVRATMPQVIPD